MDRLLWVSYLLHYLTFLITILQAQNTDLQLWVQHMDLQLWAQESEARLSQEVATAWGVHWDLLTGVPLVPTSVVQPTDLASALKSQEQEDPDSTLLSVAWEVEWKMEFSLVFRTQLDLLVDLPSHPSQELLESNRELSQESDQALETSVQMWDLSLK